MTNVSTKLRNHRTSQMGAGALEDLRMLLMAVVLFLSVASPNVNVVGGVALCAGVALTSVALGGYRLRAAEWLALAYTAWAGVSLTWSPSPGESWVSFLKALACTTVFLAVRATTNRRRDYRILAYAMVAGSLVSVWLMVASAGRLRWTYQEADLRIGVDGVNFNYTSYSLATTVVVLLSLWVGTARRGDVLRRFVLIALIVGMYLGIVLSGTRGALLSVTLVVAWWLLARFNLPVFYAVLVGVFVVFNVLMLTGWIDGILSGRISSTVRETGDLNGRLAIWPFARDQFWEAPIFGHGVGTLQQHPSNPLGIGAHSAVLDVGTGLGVLGIVLFFGALWCALNCDSPGAPQRIKFLIGGSLMAATLPIFLSGLWHDSRVLWAAVGLLSRCGAAAIPTRTSPRVHDPLGGNRN